MISFLKDACHVCGYWAIAVVRLHSQTADSARLTASACLDGNTSRLESALQQLVDNEVDFSMLPDSSTLELEQKSRVTLRELFVCGTGRAGVILLFSSSSRAEDSSQEQILTLLVAGWMAQRVSSEALKRDFAPISAEVEREPSPAIHLPHLILEWLNALVPKVRAVQARLEFYASPQLPRWVDIDSKQLRQTLDECIAPSIASLRAHQTFHVRLCLQLGEGNTPVACLRTLICDTKDDTPPALSDMQPCKSGCIQLNPTTSAPFRAVKNIKRSHRLLVAEDNELNLRFLRYFLEGLGMEAFTVQNGQALLDFVEQSPCDLILTDIQMPQVDGIQAVQQLRGRGIQTPVIALTAFAYSREVPQLLDAGFDAVLIKPVDTAQLTQTLEALLPESSMSVLDFQELRIECGMNARLQDSILRSVESNLVGLANHLIQDGLCSPQSELRLRIENLREQCESHFALPFWEEFKPHLENLFTASRERLGPIRQTLQRQVEKLIQQTKQERNNLKSRFMLH